MPAPTFDAQVQYGYSFVAAPPSPATTGTTFTVENPSYLPTPGSTGGFNITVAPVGQIPTPANAEELRVTAIVGSTLTVVRKQGGTSARAIKAGDQVYARGLKELTDMQATLVTLYNQLVAEEGARSTADAARVLSSSVGAIGGPAGPLDGSGKVPEGQLPALGGGTTFAVDGGSPSTLASEAALGIDFGTITGSFGVFQWRRGTAAAWKAPNAGKGGFLREGELGMETDTGKAKLGPTPGTTELEGHKGTYWTEIAGYWNSTSSITATEADARYLHNTGGGGPVTVTGTPGANKIIVATSSTTAEWQPNTGGLQLGEAEEDFLGVTGNEKRKVKVEGEPKSGLVLTAISNTTAQWKTPTGGLTREEVEAIALILEHGPVAVKGAAPPGGGWVIVSDLPGEAHWKQLSASILELALAKGTVARAISVSEVIANDTFNYVTTAGITVTLSGVNEGHWNVIQNASGGTIKVKAPLTPGKPLETTTIEISQGVTLFLIGDSEGVFRPISESRTLARLEELIGKPGRTIQPTGETEPALITKNKAAPYTGPIREHKASGGLQLWRQEANGAMVFLSESAVAPMISIRKPADAEPRLKVNNDGSLESGDGTKAPDAALKRTRVGVWQTSGGAEVNPAVIPGIPNAVTKGAFRGMLNGEAPTVFGTPSEAELAYEWEAGDWWLDKTNAGVWICTAKGTSLGGSKPGTFLFTSLPINQTAAAGLATQTYPLESGVIGKLLVSEHLYVAKFMLTRTITAKRLYIDIITAAAGLEYARAAVYSEAGKLLAESEDQKALWETVGPAKMKWEGATTKTFIGGPKTFGWIVVLAKGTTPPAVAVANFPGERFRDLNLGLGAAALRNGQLTAQATLPAEFTPSTLKGKSEDVPYIWGGLEE